MTVKAFVLVGGRATRLEPLTLNTPKALIPLLNVPFIEFVIRNLARYGIQDIVMGLGHLAEPIAEYLGDGSQLGVNLHMSFENEPLGSAGAARLAARHLDDTFLVFNGDNFIDLDIAEMLKVHRDNSAKVTIALTRVEDPTSFGLVESETNGKVRRFLEKPKPEQVTTDTVNAGAWLVEPEVMDLVPEGTQFSYERNVFPTLLENGERVWSFITGGYWMDTGTHEKYLRLHHDLLAGESVQYAPPDTPQYGSNTRVASDAIVKGSVIVGDNCVIETGAKLIGPVVIGDGTIVGGGSVIEDSVIWKNVRIGIDSFLKRAVIADNCKLGTGMIGEDIVLAENVTVEKGVSLESGSKIRPGELVS